MDRRETDQTFYILLHLAFLAKICSFLIEYNILPETLKKQIINSLFYLSLSEQRENKIRKVFDRVNAI